MRVEDIEICAWGAAVSLVTRPASCGSGSGFSSSCTRSGSGRSPVRCVFCPGSARAGTPCSASTQGMLHHRPHRRDHRVEPLEQRRQVFLPCVPLERDDARRGPPRLAVHASTSPSSAFVRSAMHASIRRVPSRRLEIRYSITVGYARLFRGPST